MHSIARVSVQFVYFHLYVLCLVYDEYDNEAIIISDETLPVGLGDPRCY